MVFIAGLSALRLALIVTFPMSPDEAYYWTWSRRLAFCYYDQPGMIAWVDRLFGLPFQTATVFSVRLAAVAASALTSWLLYRTYLEYRGSKGEAALFAIVFSILPFSWLAGIMIVHDTVLLPWLAASFWAIVRLVKRNGKAFDWFALALALTGAMYAKFSAVMVAWGIVLYMVVSPKGRGWWKTWPPYAAGLTAAVLYLPVILWNAEHDWISVRAVRDLTNMRELTLGDRFSYVLEYALSQVGIFNPLIGVIVFGALFKGIREAFRDPKNDEVLLPVCLAAAVFAYFFKQSFSSHVYGNWPGVAYIPAAMLGMRAVSLRVREKGGGLFGARFALAALGFNVFIIIIFSLHFHARLFSPVLRSIEESRDLDKRIDWRLDQDFEGWDELASLVEGAMDGADFILTRRYQMASMLEFQVKGQPFVECYTEGIRGNQWDVWSTLGERAGQDALYVDDRMAARQIRELCEEFTPIHEPYVIGEKTMPAKRFYIYRCSGFKGVEK